MDPLGPNAQVIEKALDLAAARHRVIAANIANVETPGYKSKVVLFDEELDAAVVREREGVNPRENGNTVVMELEMADMRKNELVYRVFIQSLIQKTRIMRAAISGGGG